MKKKGFTLVELLAVIVVLGVLAVVTVPIVFNQIETTQKESYKASVRSVFDAVSSYLANNTEIEDVPTGGIYVEDYYYNKLGLKNANFVSGRIYRNDDGVLIADRISDGTFCASGSKNNLTVVKGDCAKTDTSKPEVILVVSYTTTNSIIVHAEGKDGESGITNFKYYLNGEYVGETRKDYFIFEGLSSDKEYTLGVIGVNGNSIKSDMVTITERTKVREITMTANPGNDVWSHSKTITISYPTEYSGETYSYSINGSSNWVPVVGNTVDVLIDEDSTITAKIVYDGKETYRTAFFNKIDNEGPRIIAVDGNTNVCELSKVVTVKAVDDGVGIESYSFDGGITWQKLDETSKTSETISFSKLFTQNTVVTLAVKDKLGNISEFREEIVAFIDNSIPLREAIQARTISGETYESGKWTNQKVTLIAKPDSPSQTPNDCGAYLYQWYKKNSSGKFVAIAGATGQTLTLTSEGTNEYKVAISTVAGSISVESTNTYKVYIDKTPPTFELPSEFTNWTSETRSATFKCKDEASGCIKDSISKTWDYSIEKDKFAISFADKAGNISSYSYSSDGGFDVLVDKTPPTLELGSVITTSTTTLLIPITTLSDEHSGLDFDSVTCEYGVQGSSGVVYDKKGNVSSDYNYCKLSGLSPGKRYYYKITASDLVGNENEKASSSVTGTAGVSLIPSPSDYAQSKSVEVTYLVSNITAPTYYVRYLPDDGTSSMDINLKTSSICGNGNKPESCKTSSVSTLKAGYWYKVPSNITATVKNDGIVYGLIHDGNDYLTASTLKIDVDITPPDVNISTPSKITTSTLTIPFTITEKESGVDTIVCKYGTYGSGGVSYSKDGNIKQEATVDGVTTGTCTITNLSPGTKYYYKITATDNVENSGYDSNNSMTGTAEATVTPSPSDYAQSKSVAVKYVVANLTAPAYYVKSAPSGTVSSATATEVCGYGNVPSSDCVKKNVTSLTAGYWYKVPGNTTLTVKNDGIIYAVIYDGNKYLDAATTKVDVDITGPSVSVSSISKTTKTIKISLSVSDSESGISKTVCYYGTKASSGGISYDKNVTADSSNKCSMTGLSANTTYYYKIISTDKAGNTTTYIPSNNDITTGTTSITITGDGESCTKEEKLAVNFSSSNVTVTPSYYIKTSVASTIGSNVTKICGNQTDPATCSAITGTTSLTAGYWYKVSNSNTLTLTTAGTVYAKVNDGDTISSEKTHSVSFDTTSPSISSVSATADKTTATISSTVSDSCATTTICYYKKSSESSWSTFKPSSGSSCSLSGLSANTTYNYYLTATDQAGNSSSTSVNTFTTKIDSCNWNVHAEDGKGNYVYASGSKTSYFENAITTSYGIKMFKGVLVFSSPNTGDCELTGVTCKNVSSYSGVLTSGAEGKISYSYGSGSTGSLGVSVDSTCTKKDGKYYCSYSTPAGGTSAVRCYDDRSNDSYDNDAQVTYYHVANTGLNISNNSTWLYKY